MIGSIGRKNGAVSLLPISKYCEMLTTVSSGACGILKDMAECTWLESKLYMKLNVDDRNNHCTKNEVFH